MDHRQGLEGFLVVGRREICPTFPSFLERWARGSCVLRDGKVVGLGGEAGLSPIWRGTFSMVEQLDK